MKHQNLHKKTHQDRHGQPLPHIAAATDQETGRVDIAALKAGEAAWWKAIEDGDYVIVSAAEVGIDDETDVMVFTRKKVAK